MSSCDTRPPLNSFELKLGMACMHSDSLCRLKVEPPFCNYSLLAPLQNESHVSYT